MIYREDKQWEIGFALGVNYQGKGLALEAVVAVMSFGFDTLQTHRFYAQTDSQNIPAWKLMERLGMRREAHFHHDRLDNGEWRDTYLYAIISEEWDN